MKVTPKSNPPRKQAGSFAKPDVAQTPATPAALRDWYAGLALSASEVTVEDEDGRRFWFAPHQLAKRCYAIADAMLIERSADNADDIAVWEAALRDPRIHGAQRARIEAIFALSKIIVCSRAESAKPPSLAQLKATTTPPKVKARRTK